MCSSVASRLALPGRGNFVASVFGGGVVHCQVVDEKYS